MSHKGGIEALNLQDLRNNDKIMGGITIVLAGDFRQVLSVVQRGTRADEVNACIKYSSIWSKVEKLTLTVNMRVHLHGDANAREFTDLLLQLGDGRVQETNGHIEITNKLGQAVANLLSVFT